ncbi:transcription factor WhiB [Kribbella sp. VKM Ac-2566]|nr:transcription factor WhiB [Kribbella sp. VKM Ac-2566]
MNWLLNGACRNEDPELFFPIGTTGPALQQIEAAKRVCAQCDVVDACLNWALRTGQDAGVWGGLSEIERRALKQQRPKRVQSHSPVSTGTTQVEDLSIPPTRQPAPTRSAGPARGRR